MVGLERIELKGFKSIREMDLELRDLSILIGANGSGKSNFVSLFELIRRVPSDALPTYVAKCGGADAVLHFGRKTTQSLTCSLHIADGTGYQFRLVPSARDTLVFDEENYRTGLTGGGEERRDRAQAMVFRHLESWRTYHFHDTSDSAKVRQSCGLDDNQYLRGDGSNLAAFLYWLRERRELHYRNIVDTVRMVAPFFDDLDLHPSKLNEKVIQLEWRECGSDAYFGPEALSDGTLRFICLATLLLQPEPPPLIVVDEPELGLHPSAVALVASLLQSASAKTQVIACTQSVTLVNQFEPADIIVVDREEGQSVFRRLTEEEVKGWLDEYALGDLWEKNVIGGRI